MATARLPAASTTAVGIVQLDNTTSSTSTTTAATANALKTSYDLANAALPKTGGTVTGDVCVKTSLLVGSSTNFAAGWGVGNRTVAVSGDLTLPSGSRLMWYYNWGIRGFNCLNLLLFLLIIYYKRYVKTI